LQILKFLPLFLVPSSAVPRPSPPHPGFSLILFSENPLEYIFHFEMEKEVVVHVCTNPSFVTECVFALTERILSSLRQHGTCILGLSGGGTPVPIYEKLGNVEEIEWENVSIFLVDERYTSADRLENNANMIRRTLLHPESLAGQRVEESNITFPDTRMPLDECVRDFEARLQSVLSERWPDVVTMGMGPDYHCASLFPIVPEEILNSTSFVVTMEQDRFDVRERISTTMHVLTKSGVKLFFMRGRDKFEKWSDMIAHSFDPHRFPVHALVQSGSTDLYVEL
jgi:6-phosphogluconolactonase